MTSPDDIKLRLKSEETDNLFHLAILRDLPAALAMMDYELLGFSVKYTPSYLLLTVRGQHKGERLYAHVGSDDLRHLFIKAVGLVRTGRMRWKPDRFV